MLKIALATILILFLASCGNGSSTMANPAQVPVLMASVSAARSSQAVSDISNAISGYRAAYSITKIGESIEVRNKLTGEAKTFSGISTLKFFDKHVSFDVNGQAGQVYRLYQAAFDRKPDQVGLGYWIKVSQQGTSLTDIAGAFLTSAEFKTLYGDNVPAASYVDSLYKNVLHRAGEPDGFNWWTNTVANGADRRAVLVAFAESPENQKNLLAGMANGFDFIPFGSPIAPQMTSYLNAKNVGLTPQTIPWTGVEKTGITNGYAFADFFQNGTMTMVAFSENGAADNKYGNHTVPGSVHFFQKNGDGVWIEKTTDLLSDRTGCITPRKVIIADFNNDGRPDVLASCSGIDDSTGTGEQPRILMSQPDGKYANIGLGFNCYCHAAATIDSGSSGYADIVIVDPVIMKQPVYLKNNHNGTFTKDLNRFADEVKPWGNVGQFSRPIYTVEFIDMNNDGMPDLVLAGSEKACCENQPLSAMPTTVYKNDGKNSFTEVLATLPANMDFPLVLDMVYEDNIFYSLRVDYNYQGVAIFKDNTPIYSSRSKFQNGSYWFDWIISADGLIKPLNIAYTVAAK